MAHVNIIIVKLLIRSGHFSEKRFLTLYFFLYSTVKSCENSIANKL